MAVTRSDGRPDSRCPYLSRCPSTRRLVQLQQSKIFPQATVVDDDRTILEAYVVPSPITTAKVPPCSAM